LCVNLGGTDGCYASIQAAVDAAVDGDTIQVAEGIYYETVELTKSLTLEGGWNPDFSARDWESHPTTIDAERNGPTIWVMAAVSPTVEGFVITGGDDTAHLGWGGGIKLSSATT
jgi:pectin methylesterase-like acyl-CoA thioesterase